MPNKKLEKKINFLIKNIPRLIKNFDYRKGPDLYFYKRVISERRKRSLKKLFNEDYFFELLYATLTSWDMNARGAKMKYFDEFKENILRNKERFLELENSKIEQIGEEKWLSVKKKIEKLYENLGIMETKGKLVSNSKIMHFILPDLIMPMDRKHTLGFFFGYTNESTKRFLDIIECSWRVSRRIKFNKFVDKKEWNQTLPKVIDNAVICAMNPRYRK